MISIIIQSFTETTWIYVENVSKVVGARRFQATVYDYDQCWALYNPGQNVVFYELLITGYDYTIKQF